MAFQRVKIVEINTTFYRGQPWCGVTDDLGPDKHAKDKEFLEKYALDRWEV